jgi:hypothetical protein
MESASPFINFPIILVDTNKINVDIKVVNGKDMAWPSVTWHGFPQTCTRDESDARSVVTV